MAELGRIRIYKALRDWLPTVPGEVQSPMGITAVEIIDLEVQSPMGVVDVEIIDPREPE